MIRIVLTGAESTGKSTLAAALAKHYGEPCTAEFVRGYVDTLDRELNREDLEPIARGQLAIEDAALASASRLIIHDTNLLSSIIYAEHYFGEQPDWVEATFGERDYTLYLLCSPQGVTWEADPGQRESPEARETLQTKFQESLKRRALPFVELDGTQAERLEKARLEINALLRK